MRHPANSRGAIAKGSQPLSRIAWGVVRRAAKRGGDAAEEFLDDTTQRLQRHLVLTVATTFAVGVTAGALIGWMMKRM